MNVQKDECSAGPIQFYSEGARNTNMTLRYELLGEQAEVRVCSTYSGESSGQGAGDSRVSWLLYRLARSAKHCVTIEPGTPGHCVMVDVTLVSLGGRKVDAQRH